MRFDLHKKCRYELECSEEDYQKAQEDYFAHLRKIDFKDRLSLLRYFGNSFFHDANISSVLFDSNKKSFTFFIFSTNDLEDINYFRRNHDLSPVSYNQYSKNPIQYKCVFKKVTKLLFHGIIDLSSELVIVDTELDFCMNNDEFIVRISFSDEEEMEIHFMGQVTVKIENDRLVSELLGGLRKTVPYCEICKSRMISLGNSRKSRSANKPIQTDAGCRPRR